MHISISKLSNFNKKNWIIKHNKIDFEEILLKTLEKLVYENINLSIWKFQLDLFKEINFEIINEDNKFYTIELNSINCKFLYKKNIVEQLRWFSLKVFLLNQNYLIFDSDNYGEYTNIKINKGVSKDDVELIIKNILSV